MEGRRTVIQNRVFYNSKTGYPIFQSGELFEGGNPRPDDEAIEWVDIPVGKIDYESGYIAMIDIVTKEPTVVKYPPTPEQARIKELEEDVLLLQAENEIGGIL